MRLAYYLLLAAFGLAVFAQWSRGADPTFTAFATPEFAAFEAAPAEPSAMLQKVAPAPAAPEGFRQALSNGTIVEYRGGTWRVLPPTPSQYAAPVVAAQPPFAYGPPEAKPAGTTRTTPVTTAGARSTSYPAITGTGLITIGARPAATYGAIRPGCASGG